MTARRRGSASVGMVIALPPALLCLHGMITLFGAHYGRQRTYEALPEISHRAAKRNEFVREFRPHEEARCRTERFETRIGTSLSAEEEALCRRAAYDPPKELNRVSFEARTDLPGKIRMGTEHRATHLEEAP